MKFAHLSDTHLGYRQYGLIEREEDFYNVFNEIVDKIIDERVDFVIHSGDLFEMAKPSPNALLIFQEGLIKIKEAGIPFYSIAGNHDTIMRQNAIPPQVLFKKLGLTLISPKNPTINSSFLRDNDIFIGGTPFISKSQNSFLKSQLNNLSKKSESFSKRILVSHQGIDKYMPFEYELEIGDLPTNFNYYAMGHVHNRIVDDFGKGKLVYPGSTEIWRSNEVSDYKKNGKGFYIVDISENDAETNFEVESINIDLPREFINKTIEYGKLNSELESLETYISSLNNKPVLNITVENGSFNTGDVYKKLNNILSKITLMFRPTFRNEELIKEERYIENNNSLEPRDLLIDSLKSFENEDISNLAIDLLDFLSKDKFEDSVKISDSFYEEYFGQYETEFKKIMKHESKNKIKKTNKETKDSKNINEQDNFENINKDDNKKEEKGKGNKNNGINKEKDKNLKNKDDNKFKQTTINFN
ncbi:3',5'-cyclic adenosine monophosphate phosphodiesterase CpdA [bioreactor metagenome]|uniref:3',5'-cyclic adenosine monophosphate phosphodiesterase CpdA n=1 Tax=bioreactor metagenome TaxID=1076179 RepID=A0A644WD16_9ZZZZ|nr:DNA repair exonuclease [Methanobrevibacter sp.]MEA4958004.1 DNA repair exonuclease [Methanobrevibacter sp.]